MEYGFFKKDGQVWAGPGLVVELEKQFSKMKN